MTTFTTMTEYDIIKAAHSTILDRWHREVQHKERMNKDGLEAPIADFRIEKLDAQLRELESGLIRMEHERA